MRNRWKVLGALVVVGLGSAACSSGRDVSKPAAAKSSKPSNEAAVTIAVFALKPQTITVAAGTTVTWTNKDQILHTATSGTPEKPTGTFDGVMKDANTTFAFTFEKAGTYEYFCTRHPTVGTLRGTVIVT